MSDVHYRPEGWRHTACGIPRGDKGALHTTTYRLITTCAHCQATAIYRTGSDIMPRPGSGIYSPGLAPSFVDGGS